MLLDYISLPVFLISFALGLFFVYILGSEQKVVYVYPTPQNYTSILYKDNANQCFQYAARETKCPLNPLEIKTVPAQA